MSASRTKQTLAIPAPDRYPASMKPVGKTEETECPGCGAVLPRIDGPVHPYMGGSPACFEHFTKILAFEYSNPSLLPTHRLTVDTYAVQHPGRERTRRQIQSVGLHLARLGLQLDGPIPPKETNDVMLGLGPHKHTLELVEAPKRFSMTVANVAEHAGTPLHSVKVREWALATWNDWSAYHEYIQQWTTKWL